MQVIDGLHVGQCRVETIIHLDASLPHVFYPGFRSDHQHMFLNYTIASLGVVIHIKYMDYHMLKLHMTRDCLPDLVVAASALLR